MNNKKFKLLLKIINFLSVISLEKYWKNGVKITFKKKRENDLNHSPSEIESVNLPVAAPRMPENVA